MLGDDKLGQAANVVALAVLARLGVVLGTVNEAHYIGILLDSPRLTQVAQLRPLAILVVAALLHAAVELREGDDGDVELLGQTFQRT